MATMISWMGIGRRLDEVRRRKKIQQKKLAADVGMKPQALNKILKEHVKDPGFETVARLAVAMGVTLDELVHEERASLAGDDDQLVRLSLEQMKRKMLFDAEEAEREGKTMFAQLYRSMADRLRPDEWKVYSNANESAFGRTTSSSIDVIRDEPAGYGRLLDTLEMVREPDRSEIIRHALWAASRIPPAAPTQKTLTAPEPYTSVHNSSADEPSEPVDPLSGVGESEEKSDAPYPTEAAREGQADERETKKVRKRR